MLVERRIVKAFHAWDYIQPIALAGLAALTFWIGAATGFSEAGKLFVGVLVVVTWSFAYISQKVITFIQKTLAAQVSNFLADVRYIDGFLESLIMSGIGMTEYQRLYLKSMVNQVTGVNGQLWNVLLQKRVDDNLMLPAQTADRPNLTFDEVKTAKEGLVKLCRKWSKPL